MNRFRRMTRFPLAAIPTVLLLTSSCSNSEDPVGPGVSNDPLGENSAVSVGISSLRLVNDLILLLPEWTAGELGGIGGTRNPGTVLGSTDPEWSDSQAAWTFSDSLVVGSGEIASRYTYRYAAQYNRCNHWQREARCADEMGMWIDLRESGHGESDPEGPSTYTIDYAYRYWVNGEAAALRDTSHSYRATGGMQGEYVLTSSSGVSRYTYRATYLIDIDWYGGRCATGTVTINTDPYVVVGTYDGFGTVHWALKQAIHTRRTGTLSYECN